MVQTGWAPVSTCEFLTETFFFFFPNSIWHYKMNNNKLDKLVSYFCFISFLDRMKYMVFKGFLLYTTGTLTGKMEVDREATSSKGHPSALNWVGYQLIGQAMINTSLAVSRGLKPPKLFSQVFKVQYSKALTSNSCFSF